MSPIQLKYRTGSYRIPIYASVESEIPFRSPGNVKEYLNKGKSKMSLQTCFLFCKPRHQGTQQSILEGSRARGGTGARASFHSAGGQTTNPRRKAERRYLRIEKRNQEAARAPGSRTPHLVHTRTKSPPPRAEFRRIIKGTHLGGSRRANPSAGQLRLGLAAWVRKLFRVLAEHASRRRAVPFPRLSGRWEKYKGGVCGPGSASWRALSKRGGRQSTIPAEATRPPTSFRVGPAWGTSRARRFVSRRRISLGGDCKIFIKTFY
jgi:hypothetical protein